MTEKAVKPAMLLVPFGCVRHVFYADVTPEVRDAAQYIVSTTVDVVRTRSPISNLLRRTTCIREPNKMSWHPKCRPMCVLLDH